MAKAGSSNIFATANGGGWQIEDQCGIAFPLNLCTRPLDRVWTLAMQPTEVTPLL